MVHRPFLLERGATHFILQVWAVNTERRIIAEGRATCSTTHGSTVQWHSSLDFGVEALRPFLLESLPPITQLDPKVMIVTNNSQTTSLVALMVQLERESIPTYIFAGAQTGHGARSLRYENFIEKII